LPLAGVEYVSGAESRRDTGEPHALDGEPRPDSVQSFTWCFAMGFDPAVRDGDDRYRIGPPASYDTWRRYVPDLRPPWSGPLLDWSYSHPVTLEPIRRTLFPHESPEEPWRGLWHYRQIFEPAHLNDPAVHAITLVNWPQNDYWLGNLIDCPPADQQRYEQEARELSLSLFYWLQNEAPRPDGGTGYPGLYLVPDVLGTRDGLAMAPYIRESRRIRARFTVTENHVGTDALGGRRPAPFPDSVGIGYYRIDLHPSTGGDNYIDIPAQPFQIPLGALIPQRVENLLPACKNLGTTHITNGCYRLHPVEWNIGEAAGLLAAFCLEMGIPPAAVHEQPDRLAAFQALLTQQGIELAWPEEVFST
ncbi:MAG TPA: FAD-dependent oxidoreductase, partial [Phycisphaeraceae bacterium]